MSDLPADVQKIRQQLQAALEQAAQWQQRYEAQAPKSSGNISPDTTDQNPFPPLELPPSSSDRDLNELPENLPLTDVTELQRQLTQAQAEITRLTAALAQEQANHAKTRQNLTNALADAIENLTRLRNQPPRTP